MTLQTSSPSAVHLGTGQFDAGRPAPASASAPASGQVQEPAAPGLTYLATFAVEVAAPIELGDTVEGPRRIIPITGGTVSGPRLNGRILPGGADFQLLRTDTLTELEAKYAVETDSGERIYVTNFGLRSGSPEDIAALVRGESVPAERIYFRCTPRVLASGPEWGWLSSRIIIGSGTRLPSEVRLDLWVVD